MSEIAQVFALGALVAAITYLGAPVAERFDLPAHIVGGALQLAAGVLVATVALELMPAAAEGLRTTAVVVCFFVGGAAFVLLHYTSAKRLAPGGDGSAIGLHLAVLTDMVVDGVVIGVGAALSLATGLRLGIALAMHQLVLAFVSIATAKRQGMPKDRRRWLALAFLGGVALSVPLGYFLGGLPGTVSVVLLAAAGGFLATAIAQAMIPEAVRVEGPSLSGIWFVVGMSVFGLLKLAARSDG